MSEYNGGGFAGAPSVITSDKLRGVVQFFNNNKGWGIIMSEKGDVLHVHHTDIVDKKFFPDKGPKKYRTLKTKEKVSFIIMGNDNKYWSATDVRILDEKA